MIKDIARVYNWGPYLLEVYNAHNEQKEDTIAFLTLWDNTKHLEVLRNVDELRFDHRRLACKPNGFTNEKTNDNLAIRYRQQREDVFEFNDKHYTGSLNTPSIKHNYEYRDERESSIQRSYSPASKRPRAEDGTPPNERRIVGYGSYTGARCAYREPSTDSVATHMLRELSAKPQQSNEKSETSIPTAALITFAKHYHENSSYRSGNCAQNVKWMHECQRKPTDYNNNTSGNV